MEVYELRLEVLKLAAQMSHGDPETTLELARKFNSFVDGEAFVFSGNKVVGGATAIMGSGD